MFLIVVDIELTQKNKIKELGLFIDGSLHGFSFCPPKPLHLINRQHRTQLIYMDLRGVVESCIMVSSLLSVTT